MRWSALVITATLVAMGFVTNAMAGDLHVTIINRSHASISPLMRSAHCVAVSISNDGKPIAPLSKMDNAYRLHASSDCDDDNYSVALPLASQFEVLLTSSEGQGASVRVDFTADHDAIALLPVDQATDEVGRLAILSSFAPGDDDLVTIVAYDGCSLICLAQKIDAALGNPSEPSLNRTAKITRDDAGIPENVPVLLQIVEPGGSSCDLPVPGAGVVKINAVAIPNGGPIPDGVVPAYGHRMPLANAFADVINVQTVSVDAALSEEMARVIRPGGKIIICGPIGDTKFQQAIAQFDRHGIQATAMNDRPMAPMAQREIVFNVGSSYSYMATVTPTTPKCDFDTSLRPMSGGDTPHRCSVSLAVFYTYKAQADARARQDDIAATIRRRVDALSRVWSNSQTEVAVQLVHVGPTAYDEQLDGNLLDETRKILESEDEVNVRVNPNNEAALHALWASRAALGADLVDLTVGGQVAGGCGIGSKIVRKAHGYSVVKWQCPDPFGDEYALAHEVGHNFGLGHDRTTDNFGGHQDSTGYAYGYIDRDGRFFTVMSYASTCSRQHPGATCSGKPYYSSPDDARFNINGRPIGSATADNRRALMENAPFVSRYNDPVGDLAHSPNFLDFKDVQTGGSATRSLEIFNTRAQAVTLAEFLGGIASPFHIDGAASTCNNGTVIQAQSSCKASIVFSPTRETISTQSLSLSFSGASNASSIIELKGRGLNGKADLVFEADNLEVDAPGGIEFGNVVENRSLILAFENRGTSDLVVTSAALSGDASFALSLNAVEDNPCTGFPGRFVVMPKNRCRAGITFHPRAVGDKAAATLTIQSNDATSPSRIIPVTGYGIHGEL